MIRFFAIALLTLTTVFCNAQDFSNKGKDFWVGYGNHVKFTAGNAQDMVLYFATEAATNVTITIPALAYTASYAIAANTIFTTAVIPKSGAQDARLVTEGISSKGIHVVADKPVVAYAHIYNMSVSGATLLFPTNTLGREYFSINYDQKSNESGSYCFFYAIATDTGTTTIEVIPSANTQTMVAGNTYTYNLQQGQVFNALGTITGNNGVDLTGSKIRSISTAASGCKPIAVFSGSGKIYINCATNQASSADNYMVQSFPKTAWGKRFLTAPTAGLPNNLFRVCVSDPTALVKVDGIPITGLIGNFYYQISQTGTPHLIEADKPITIAQYITTQGACGNGSPGDPEMIYLSPIEQNLNKVILNSTNNFAITAHYINVVIPTNGINSFRIDGLTALGSFSPHPGLPGYSYGQLSVGAGQHNILSDSGFNAIAYGYGNAESYGYNAGSNVKDLFQHIVIQNQFATIDFPATCVATPFFFSITLPYQATSLNWDFHGSFANVTNNAPVPDSSYVIDGKMVYVYKLPLAYTFSAIGTYPVSVTATNPTSEGCSGTNVIDYDVEVFEKPKADWTYTHSGCLTDTVHFMDATNANGRTVTKWKWEFGDATIDSVRNPNKLYTVAGTYPVKLFIITDVGCFADTSKPLTISSPPIAKFGATMPACPGQVVTLTDSSTIATGTIVKWYWNYGNGVQEILTTNAPRMVTYAASGSYTVTLQVESSTGCKSTVFSKSVIVSPLAFVDFALPGNVCLPVGAAQFMSLSTISDGTQALFKYKWEFGDGGIDSVQNPLHVYTTTGPFMVKLTVTSSSGCTKDTTKQFATIFARPSAGFMAATETCLRDSVLFTDQSNPAGQVITNWNWDFADASPISTLTNPGHLYANANTYQVKHWIVTDKGCKSDTIIKPITINPLPTALFLVSSPACETQNVTFTNQSTPNVGNIVRWQWNLGDATFLDLANGNPFTHPYATTGMFTSSLVVTTNKGCNSDTLKKTVTVNPIPVVNFGLPPVCLSDAFAQFSDSSSISDGTQAAFTYLWNFGDAASTPANPNTAAIKNPKHKYSATGLYTVTLTVTSSSGCKVTATKQITVNGDVPIANFIVPATPVNLCNKIPVKIQNKSTVNFGSVSQLDIYWDWIGNPTQKDVDNNTSFDKIYSHTYPSAAQASKQYTIRVVAYSGGTCLDDSLKTITVYTNPSALFGATPTAVCSGSPITVTDQSINPGFSVTNWSYNFGDATTSNLQNTTHLYTQTGPFTISFSNITDKGCLSDTVTKMVTVYPKPIANAGVDLFVLEGGQAVINATVSGSTNYQYLWTPATWLNTDTALKPITMPQDDITYTLTVTAEGGCTGTDMVFVKLLKAPEIPTAFSPNKDGINDTWEIKYLESYPGSVITVFDRYGRQVYSSIGYAKAWDGKLKGTDLPIGVYYYILDPKNGRKTITGSVTILR